MKSWKKWLLLTGIFYLFYLAWLMPAALCWKWAAPRLGPAAAKVKAAGILGAWSNGRMASLQNGPLRLTDLTWSFRPLGLLTGRLKFDLTAKLLEQAPISTTLTLSPKQQGLQNVRGQVPAALLGEALLPGLGLSGNLISQDLDLSLKQGFLASARGNLDWQDAGVAFPEPTGLGNLSLQLATDSGIIAATLKDQGGPMSVNVLARLQPDGTYELTGALLPRGQMTPELASMMRLFGKPAADGRILLQRRGRLKAIY
jgi:hypothetical protein